MSKDPCFDAVKKAVGEGVSDQTISRALREMREVQGANMGDLMSFQQKAITRITEVTEILSRQRKEAAENLVKTRERLDFYSQKAFQADPAEAVKARLSKTSLKSMEGNKSVELQSQGLFARFANNLISAMQRDGVFDFVVKKREHLADVYAELDALQRGTPRGATRNEIAQKAALAIHTVQQDILNMRRNAGFTVKEAEGWIIRRTHDPDRMTQAGFDKWYADIRPMLDLEKTFPEGLVDEGQVEVLLREVYNNVVTGKRGGVGSPGVSDELVRITQIPANLNKLRSQSRVLAFKSPFDEYQYNQAYGRGDLLDTLYHQLRQAAKDIALVNVYGTNPGAAFEADLVRIKSGLTDRKKLDAFQAEERRLRNLWDEVNGLTTIPGKSLAAKLGSSARALTAMATMGKSALMTIGDVPIQAMMLKTSTGKNILEATADVIANQAKAMAPGIRSEWARRTGQLINDSIGDLHLAFGAGGDAAPGAISQASRIFFKLNLLQQRTFISRAAIAKQYAVEFGKLADRQYAALDPLARTQLARYGVDAEVWDIVRTGVEELDGDRAITLDAIDQIPAERFADLAKERGISADRAKLNAWLAVSTMYTDAALLGTVTPSGRERSRIIYGTREDDVMGQMLRFAYQFKGAPMASWDVFSRVLLNKAPDDMKGVAQAILSGKGDMLSSAQLMVGLTMAGYMAMSLGDLASGKTPRDPRELKTFTEAMTKGGALGLYGDFLMGEYDRQYRSLPADIVGPVTSRAGEALKLFAKMRSGDAKAAEALNFAINNMPGLNLFYTRGAMNYLFLYQLQETLSPGFARRAEQRARENPGLLEDRQRYFIRPTEVVR